MSHTARRAIVRFVDLLDRLWGPLVVVVVVLLEAWVFVPRADLSPGDPR